MKPFYLKSLFILSFWWSQDSQDSSIILYIIAIIDNFRIVWLNKSLETSVI